MKFSVDFSPQISGQLSQAARVRGVDPANVLESLVSEYLPPVASTSGAATSPKYKTPQEHIAAMDAIAANNADLPVLSNSAFDRENIYEDGTDFRRFAEITVVEP